MDDNNVASEGSLEKIEIPEDSLGHDEIAEAILNNAVRMAPGSVIAVQGPWGRGKTDVLLRVSEAVRGRRRRELSSTPFWVNPWQYGTPDLLNPIVLSLLERIPPQRRSGSEALMKAAESVIRAGTNFGFKAMALTVPWGKLYDPAAGAVDTLLDGLFKARGLQKEPEHDPDPVAMMGKRFGELVVALLESEGDQKGSRVVICVDDMDRCLPDRQVALLEAIRFLISAKAPVTFLIGLDPTLARQAVTTHYKTEAFDPDRYLDKMFDLRINLPAITFPNITSLVRGHLERMVSDGGTNRPLKSILFGLLGEHVEQLEDAAYHVLWPADFRNPRIIRRIFDRLHLLAASGAEARTAGVENAEDVKLLLQWLGLIERWPDFRRCLQHAEDFVRVFRGLCAMYAEARTNELDESILASLPARDKSPDLIGIMRDLQRKSDSVARKFEVFDHLLVKSAL